MPELMTAIYRSNLICIFDLLDKNGQYIEEVRSEYRKASQANELFCPECHGGLELCAGVIMAPYFRHKSVLDCPISRELKTEAGKRMHYGKKMLFALAKTASNANVTLKERNADLPYNPILIDMAEKTEAFLYLDGSSRNYEEVRKAQKQYKEQDIVPYWFLHKKYQSNSKNVTSNEAEVAMLNDDILYYVDPKKHELDFRKAYTSPYGERRYYTETVSEDKLVIEEDGSFNQEFLINYESYVKKQKQNLDRILRIPQENGVDELYFDFSYVYMTSLNEIWILPKFQITLEDIELNEKAIRHREDYLSYWNEAFEELIPMSRQNEAMKLMNEVNNRKNAYNWIS